MNTTRLTGGRPPPGDVVRASEPEADRPNDTTGKPTAQDVKLVPTSMLRKRGGLQILLGISVLVLAWSCLQIAGFSDHPTTSTSAVSVCAFLWLAFYVASTWSAFGTPYLLTSAYILAMMAFNFGLIAQDGFGFIHVGGYEEEFGHWATLAGWYANLALGCLGTGFATSLLTMKPGAGLKPDVAAALTARNLARLRNLGVGLCLACLVFLLIGIGQVGNLLQYNRNQLFFSGMDIRGIALVNWFGPSAAIAMLISARTPSQRRWSYVLGVVALAIYLLSGNRSMAMFPLLVGICIWVKSGRRFPLPVAAGLALAAILVIPVIGALRTMGAYDKISFSDISTSSESASVSAALAELGGSAGVLAITLQYVPAEEPFRYGSTYLGYVRQVIPNVGGKTDISESPRAIIAESGSLSAALPKLNPSTWASIKVLGVQGALYAGQGVGFSGIAEPYFNFGFAGVVVYFLAVGVFFARMESKSLLLSFRWLAFATFFYWFYISTVRNEFGVFVKPASFILITMGVWMVVRRFTPYAKA